jgi:hypothetical protein
MYDKSNFGGTAMKSSKLLLSWCQGLTDGDAAISSPIDGQHRNITIEVVVKSQLNLPGSNYTVFPLTDIETITRFLRN